MTGFRVIFLGLKFWPKVIFWSMKDTGIVLDLGKKKGVGFFWIVRKGLRDFFGYAKK